MFFALEFRSHLGAVRLQNVVQTSKSKGFVTYLFGFVPEPSQAAERSQHGQVEQVEEVRLV